MTAVLPASPRGRVVEQFGHVQLVAEASDEDDSYIVARPGHASADIERALVVADGLGLVMDVDEIEPEHQPDGTIMIYLIPEED